MGKEFKRSKVGRSITNEFGIYNFRIAARTIHNEYPIKLLDLYGLATTLTSICDDGDDDDDDIGQRDAVVLIVVVTSVAQ